VGSGIWTNTLGAMTWSSTTNWLNSTVANGVDSTADFNELNLPAGLTVHLDAARTNGNLVFGDLGNAYGWTLDNNGNSANILTLAVSSGTPKVTVNNQTNTISAGLAGTNGLTKAGAGTLTLSGANTLTNGLTVNGGSLVLQRPTTNGGIYISGSMVVNSGASLTYNNSSGTTLDGGWANGLTVSNGTVNVTGGAIVRYNGFNMTGGTFNWTAGGGLYGPTINTYAASTTATIAGTGGGYGAPFTFNVARGTAAVDLTVSMPITGSAASITLNGGGIMQLSGANTYAGATRINGGTLALTGSGTVGSGTNLFLGAGATFDVTGTAGFTLAAGRILEATNGATATLAGNVNASAAGLVIGYTNGVPAINVANGTLTLAAGTAATVNINNGGLPLAGGSYKLIAKATGGAVGGVAPASVSFGGDGVATNTVSLTITNGELYLVVPGQALSPPTLSRITQSGNAIVLNFSGPSGQTYKILTSTNVAAPITNWSVVASGSFSGLPTSYTNSPAVDRQRYYRLTSP